MKKTTKSLLITSLILLAFGLLLSLGSAIYVTALGIDAFGVKQNVQIIEDKTVSLKEILSQSPESNYVKGLAERPFTKLDLSSYAGDIVVIPTNGETHVTLNHTNTSNLSVCIVGETLEIREIDPVGFFGLYIDDNGFSFKGLRQIFGPGNSANSGKTVTVYLNENDSISSINVRSKIGSVTLDSLSVDLINIDSFSGKVLLKNLSNPESKITCNAQSGSIILENNQYASCNASIKSGKISATLSDDPNTVTVLDAWVGSVNVICNLPLESYKLSLSTTLGSVYSEEEAVGSELKQPSNTTSRVSSSVVVGSIKIK